MNTTRIIASGVTGASLLLTSFPAYATNVNVQSNGSAKVGSFLNLDKEAKAEIKADYKKAKAEAKAEYKADLSAAKAAYNAEKKATVSADVDADANVSTSVLVKVREHLTAIVKRVIARAGAVSKHICNREPNETAVQACIDKAKADFKATVEAAINLSFGA